MSKIKQNDKLEVGVDLNDEVYLQLLARKNVHPRYLKLKTCVTKQMDDMMPFCKKKKKNTLALCRHAYL